MAEQSDRRSQYEQILKETDGMTQEQRWDYYDAHQGTHQIVWEFRHKNVVKDTVLNDFDSAVKALGLSDEIEAIDKATEGLNPLEFVDWLEAHPSAKETYVKVHEVIDSNSKV